MGQTYGELDDAGLFSDFGSPMRDTFIEFDPESWVGRGGRGAGLLLDILLGLVVVIQHLFSHTATVFGFDLSLFSEFVSSGLKCFLPSGESRGFMQTRGTMPSPFLHLKLK